MLEMDGPEMTLGMFSVPDLIYERLQKNPNNSQPRCPHCKRIVTNDDIDSFTVKVTGQKGDQAYYSKLGSRLSGEGSASTFSVTFRKKHSPQQNYLVKGHDEPPLF